MTILGIQERTPFEIGIPISNARFHEKEMIFKVKSQIVFDDRNPPRIADSCSLQFYFFI